MGIGRSDFIISFSLGQVHIDLSPLRFRRLPPSLCHRAGVYWFVQDTKNLERPLSLSINPKTNKKKRVFTRFWIIHAWSPKRVFAMFLDLLCSFALHFSYVSPATPFMTIRQPPPSIENEASVASILSRNSYLYVCLESALSSCALSSAA